VSFEEFASPSSGDCFGTPDSAPHGRRSSSLPSRRELREAERLRLEVEAARSAAVPVAPFVEVPRRVEPVQRVEPVETSPQVQRVEPVETSPASPELSARFLLQPSAAVQDSRRDAERAARRDRQAAASKSKRSTARSKSLAKLAHASVPEVGTRKLRRAERRIVRGTDAPKRERKNPLSVLVTMVAVGGMFALAGLPAYAQFDQQVGTEAARTDAAAQDLLVSGNVTALAPARDGYTATSPEALAEMSRDAIRAAANAAYLASGARELGDDYPWPYELTDDMGGGLSPLNYYYRECVDFVAWRLNRDQGYFAAPFKWVWSTLTPTGGNGGQWQYAWEAHGWPISKVPIQGAVAYTGGNHVAYVRSVNADGTVTVEEYNYVPGAYSQRTIPASSVVSFLYPPT
jgi:hypothetical protein